VDLKNAQCNDKKRKILSFTQILGLLISWIQAANFHISKFIFNFQRTILSAIYSTPKNFFYQQETKKTPQHVGVSGFHNIIIN